MSLVDRDTRVNKSSYGLPPAHRVAPRNVSICGHVVGHNEMIVVEDLSKDPRFADNPAVRQSGARFYAGAPLRTDSRRAIGTLCIVDTKPRHISDTEKQLLQMIADGLMAEVKLRLASRRLLEHNRVVDRELVAARRVQRFLMAPEHQQGKGFDFYHMYHPFDRIGGDFIDTRLREDGSLVLLMADVSGHGAAAALTSAMVKTSFLRAAPNIAHPQELLTALHRDLRHLVDEGRFMTAIVAMFNPHNRLARFASAGHPHPFLLRGSAAELLAVDNELALLVEDEFTYTRQTRHFLGPGDRVVFYTDGATEAANPAGERLDPPGLQRLLVSASAFSGPPLLHGVFSGINAFAHGHLQDDVALACLEVC